MAHEIEIIDGKASMVWVGDPPWHGLGIEVSPDLAPSEMLKAASLDWEVKKYPAYANVHGKHIGVQRSALIRESDHSVLDIVGDDWNPTQNAEAFEFFADFVKQGDMEMHTAGSLQRGKIVWALAKVKESFTICKHDRIDSYMLFTNPHTFGKAIDVRFTPIRVVCNNTLTLSLASKKDNMVRSTHRAKFDAEEVKEKLGIAKHKLKDYRDMATFLSSKKYTQETVKDYFKEVFPVISAKEKEDQKVVSLGASRALTIMETQPGNQYGKGTFWSAFNAVSFLTDHLIGRSADNRLTSAWYGANKGLKLKALELAVNYAKAA